MLKGIARVIPRFDWQIKADSHFSTVHVLSQNVSDFNHVYAQAIVKRGLSLQVYSGTRFCLAAADAPQTSSGQTGLSIWSMNKIC